MPAVPYRAELRARAIGSCAGILVAAAVAGAMIAAWGRHGDLNLGWITAVTLPVAVLVGAALYTSRRQRLEEQLLRPRALPPEAERIAPARVRWPAWIVRGLACGLALGGLALLIDFEVDVLAIVLAVALGGVLGEDGANALIVRRYERAHGGTIYRVEDPPGTDAGLVRAG